MNILGLERSTTGLISLGALAFADGDWHIKVSIKGGANYLLNLTGEVNSPLTRADDDSTDECTVLANGFNWFPEGDVPLGMQVSPRHLSLVVGTDGPMIAAVIEGRHMFFDLHGGNVNRGIRGCIVVTNWTICVREAGSQNSWRLVSVGPTSS